MILLWVGFCVVLVVGLFGDLFLLFIWVCRLFYVFMVISNVGFLLVGGGLVGCVCLILCLDAFLFFWFVWIWVCGFGVVCLVVSGLGCFFIFVILLDWCGLVW